MTNGEPAKKGTSKCWFIGCGILLVLVILGGVGSFLARRYALKKGSEAAQNIQQQLEEQGVQFEGQDSSNGSDTAGDQNGNDDSASPSNTDDTSSSDDSAGVPDASDIDWGQVTDNMPEGAADALQGIAGHLSELADSDAAREAMRNLEGAAPKVALHMFFIAWQMGQVDQARKLMTDKLSKTVEDSVLDGGYTQEKMDVQEEKKLSDNAWEYRVEESFRMKTGDATQTALYRVKLIKSDGHWLVDELETLEHGND